MTTKPLAIAAAISLTLGSALATIGTAHAEAPVRQVEVAYSDLDLTSDAGRATLDRRLDKAAKVACDYDAVSSGMGIVTREAKTCYAKARSLATEQVAAIVNRENFGG